MTTAPKYRADEQAFDAEQSILGAMMLDRSRGPVIADGLDPSWLSHPDHVIILRAAQRCAEAGTPIDPVAISSRLGEREARLVDYVHELADEAGTAVNWEHHAGIIRDAHQLRVVRRIATAFAHQVIAAGVDSLEVIAAEAEKVARAAADMAADIESFEMTGHAAAKVALDEIRERYEALHNGQPEAPRMRTGLDKGWDEVAPLEPGSNTLIAKRSSDGKTAQAIFAACEVASQGLFTVGYISVEVRPPSLMYRYLSWKTGIDLRVLRRGVVKTEDSGTLIHHGRLASKDLHLYHRPGGTIEDAVRWCKSLARKTGKPCLFVLDYLQRAKTTRGSGYHGGREREVAYISEQWVTLATQLNAAVISCAQVNRDSEKQRRAPKGEADLRESSAPYHDADNVVFGHTPSKFEAEDADEFERTSPELQELHWAKVRDGETGVVPVRYERSIGRFSDWEGPR